MRTILLLGLTTLATVSTMACSASVTNNPGSDGGSQNGNDGSTQSGNDGSVSTSDGGTIDIQAACTTTPCGGSVDGTWDYVHGCVKDPLKDLKTMCQTLQVNNQKGWVNGSVTFQNGTVKRSGTATYSAQIIIPVECTQNVPCSTFTSDGIVCSGAGACTCNVSKTDSIADSDTYTLQGTTVVTGSGNKYDYCVQGSKLTYTEVGNVQHEGVFDLAKR